MHELTKQIQDGYRQRVRREMRAAYNRISMWKRDWNAVHTLTPRACTCGGDHKLLATNNFSGETVFMCPVIYYLRWRILARERDDVDEPSAGKYHQLIGVKRT